MFEPKKEGEMKAAKGFVRCTVTKYLGGQFKEEGRDDTDTLDARRDAYKTVVGKPEGRRAFETWVLIVR
jgi:hypothetical protein